MVRIRTLFTVFVIVSCSLTYGQNKKENILQTKERTLKEIEYANRLLKETQGKTKESLNEIEIINHKLDKRKEYLLGIEVEANILDGTINENYKEISTIQSEIEKIKKIYAGMIVNSYKHRSENYAKVYFFASENFNQFYKRLRMVKVYQNYIKRRKNELEQLKEDLSDRISQLENQKNIKSKLIRNTKIENSLIKGEIDQKNVLVSQLMKKQKEIEEEIRQKEKTAKKLDDELLKIINEERKKIKKNEITEKVRTEDKIISDDFEKNVGRLPWPTKTGIITGKYGEHKHPDYKGVTVRNDGIYITTTEGTDARAIFKGIVSKVFTIPGENYTVIIKHGKYYSLYHNLINVCVKAGQSVETKQKIATVFTNENTKETILYFQLWKETERKDPELWLSSMYN
jgi:murein hydrolase activator